MSARARLSLQTAATADAPQVHALIAANIEAGHLLPRTLDELTTHAERFVVARLGTRIVACAELAPLSPLVAEVRSLVVDPAVRGTGVGTTLVQELTSRARHQGFDRLCAFTHCPAYFTQFGFSIVPHLWIPEKIAADCARCPSFRRCGQYAMVVDLDEAHERPAYIPLTAISASSHSV